MCCMAGLLGDRYHLYQTMSEHDFCVFIYSLTNSLINISRDPLCTRAALSLNLVNTRCCLRRHEAHLLMEQEENEQGNKEIPPKTDMCYEACKGGAGIRSNSVWPLCLP